MKNRLAWYEWIWMVPLGLGIAVYAEFQNWRAIRSLKKAVRNGTFGKGTKK